MIFSNVKVIVQKPFLSGKFRQLIPSCPIIENMEYAKSGDQYLIRLLKDQEIFATLERFALETGVQAGSLTGIGALKNVELGFYHLEQKEYERKHFADEAELLGLTGNLSLLEERPFFHIHAVLGASDFSTYGGHLFSAQVAVTMEIHLTPLHLSVSRKHDPSIGLNLLSLCPG